MTIKELKQSVGYEFECNMSNEYKEYYKEYDSYDEWGCAFVWLGENIGAEYNFAIETYNDEVYTACAIYKMKFNNKADYMETDYDTFIHYDIDFNNENWEEELENAMCKAIIKFFEL